MKNFFYFFLFFLVKLSSLDFSHVINKNLVFADSEKFISSATFFSIADHACFLKFIKLIPKEVKPGDIIYIPEMMVSTFCSYYHTRIPNPYILVVHTSGLNYPNLHLEKIVDDPKLIRCFCLDLPFKHPKMEAIPLGITPHVPVDKKDVDVVKKNRQLMEEIRERNFVKKNLCYVNFIICSKIRAIIHSKLKYTPFCLVRTERVSKEVFFQEVAESHFVLSPPGDNEDSFRTWEALYLGSFPIVLSSPLDTLFEGLPVVIVKNFDEVTEDFLLKKLEEFSNNKEFNFQKLSPEYWKRKILSCKERFLNNS